jgi:hypothetical protein
LFSGRRFCVEDFTVGRKACCKCNIKGFEPFEVLSSIQLRFKIFHSILLSFSAAKRSNKENPPRKPTASFGFTRKSLTLPVHQTRRFVLFVDAAPPGTYALNHLWIFGKINLHYKKSKEKKSRYLSQTVSHSTTRPIFS